MVRAIHFVLRQGSEILDLAVPLATVKLLAWLFIGAREKRGKGSHQAFVAAALFCGSFFAWV